MQPNQGNSQQAGDGGPTGGNGNQAPPLAPWPFPVGVLGTENLAEYDNTRTMIVGTVKFPDVRVEPDGWLRGIWFDFDLVTAGNAATVVFAADSPFAAIDTVLFRDTGGEQIFGPFSGYDWMVTNKFGGYQAQGDPRADVNFSVTAGVGAGLGGSAHWCLYLPLEIASADALGDVENRSENSIYRVELTMASSANVYTTAPTTLGTLQIRTLQDAYTEPVAAMSLSGRPVSTAPPSPGTLQYWKQEAPLVPAGTGFALITNGIGNGYRNIHFKLVRNAGTRANGDADWPDPFELTLGTTRIRNLRKNTWISKQSRAFQLTNAVADTAQGRENGVFPLWFNQDVGIKPGNEARRRLQRTKTGNTFKARGAFGNAGTLFITSNYIVPRGNDFSQVVA
jgi:hypothetical protein